MTKDELGSVARDLSDKLREESAEKDGGPAFPSEQGHIPDGTWNQTWERGMSLRDWFAGRALTGLLAGDAHPDVELVYLMDSGVKIASRAAFAYRIADAMISERKWKGANDDGGNSSGEGGGTDGGDRPGR